MAEQLQNQDIATLPAPSEGAIDHEVISAEKLRADYVNLVNTSTFNPDSMITQAQGLIDRGSRYGLMDVVSTHQVEEITEYGRRASDYRRINRDSTGYLESNRDADEQTGLHLRYVDGNIRSARFNPEAVSVEFSFTQEEGESDLDAMTRWAEAFVPKDQLDETVEEINRQRTWLKEHRNEGSNSLYGYSKAIVRLEGDKVFIGVDKVKNYDDVNGPISSLGIRIDATPDVLANLDGVVTRQLDRVKPIEEFGEIPTGEVVEAQLKQAARDSQERIIAEMDYSTPDFDELSRQELIDAGVIQAVNGETVTEISDDDKKRILGIVKDLQNLNAAHEVIDTEAKGSGNSTITYNYEHTSERKWGKEAVTAYSIGRDGIVKAIRQRPDAPQQWAPTISEHVFTPANQQRAAELVDSLANKKARQEALESAKQVIADTEHNKKAA